MPHSPDSRGRYGAPSPRVLYALELIRKMGTLTAIPLQREKFGVCRSTAIDDIKKAVKLLAEEVRAMMPTLAQESIAHLERIREKAEAKGDERAAVMAQREISKIAGLDAPTKVEHTGRDGGPIETEVKHNFEDLTDEQLRALAVLDAKKA